MTFRVKCWTNRVTWGVVGLACLAAPALRAADAPACDPDNAGIKLPPGFCAFVAADGIGVARHMTVAGNGDLYVALMDGGVDGCRHSRE